MGERFSRTTTVRRPRTALLWGLAGLMVVFFLAQVVFAAHFRGFQGLGALPYWLIGPVMAAIQRRPKIERAAIEASSEGLRIGDKLVPREKLKSALLRRERDKTFVVLRGKSNASSSVDVEVSSDEEADALCRALALDAASTTAEFTLFRGARSTRTFAVIAAAAGAGAAIGVTTSVGHIAHIAPLVFFAFFVFMLLPLLIFSRRAKLRVGADGVVVREGFSRRRFVPHDEIESVSANGTAITIARKHGAPIELTAGSADRGRRKKRKHKQIVELERQAQSIVWRLEKAREAYAALAGNAPQAALALDRGEKSTREWLEQLRRVGAGAAASFRQAELTREQLLRIVESTSAAARERIAAVAALHDALTEEEKPRIRVAAERCAQPALGEALVRVATAPTEEELESALEESAALSEAGERAVS